MPPIIRLLNSFPANLIGAAISVTMLILYLQRIADTEEPTTGLYATTGVWTFCTLAWCGALVFKLLKSRR